jgi:ABC-2 type transport system ATP-binding protein
MEAISGMTDVAREPEVPEVCASGSESPDIIRIDDITKIFQNKQTVTAVDHVSFAVRRGEIFGLLGPNGAGKSTLIRILTTLMKPTSGTACVDRYSVGKDDEGIRSIIGVCPQNSTLDIELTAYDNLDFYGNLLNVDEHVLPERILELLEMVGLADWADMPVKTFSGGMRRKLEIVRAFLHHPLILFLDEPTIGLDPESRREVWQQIARLNTENTTIILTTHYMDEAEKLCNRIAFMNRGRLIALDTPENLKKVIPTGELIEIGYATLDPAVIPIIRDRDDVRSVEVQDQLLRISVQNGSHVLPLILADLEQHSVQVLSITIRAPSLEDVFIYLTGTGLEGG